MVVVTLQQRLIDIAMNTYYYDGWRLVLNVFLKERFNTIGRYLWSRLKEGIYLSLHTTITTTVVRKIKYKESFSAMQSNGLLTKLWCGFVPIPVCHPTSLMLYTMSNTLSVLVEMNHTKVRYDYNDCKWTFWCSGLLYPTNFMSGKVQTVIWNNSVRETESCCRFNIYGPLKPFIVTGTIMRALACQWCRLVWHWRSDCSSVDVSRC